jgi:hypothetical protein
MYGQYTPNYCANTNNRGMHPKKNWLLGGLSVYPIPLLWTSTFFIPAKISRSFSTTMANSIHEESNIFCTENNAKG